MAMAGGTGGGGRFSPQAFAEVQELFTHLYAEVSPKDDVKEVADLLLDADPDTIALFKHVHDQSDRVLRRYTQMNNSRKRRGARQEAFK
jgi:hypothetical protein